MEEDQIKFCPKCGKTLKSGQYFCSDCGWKVEKVTQNFAPYQPNKSKMHRKHNFRLAAKIIIACFLIIIAVLAGYNRYFKEDTENDNGLGYINMVKKAHYNDYKKFSYGQVLGQYCDDEKWKYFRADDGSNIVEYTAENGVYNGKNSRIKIQFICKNGKVTYTYFGVDGKDENILNLEKFMNTVYASYLPEGANRNIISLMDEKISTIEEKYCINADDDMEEILQDAIKIKYLSNYSWSVTDYDNDGNIDGVSINNGTKYNIIGLTYGQDYNDALSKLPYGYKHNGLVYEGRGIIYAQNDRYYMRIKFEENKINDITLVDAEKAKMAGEQIISMNDDDAADSSDNENSNDDNADYDDTDSEDYDDSDYYDDTDDSEDYYDDDDISQEAIDARWDDSDSYILPYSDVEKLKKSDIEKLDLKTIQFAINEICAREGRRFLDHKSNTKYPELKDYFENKDWYTPKYDSKKFDSNVKKYLNDVEYYNYDLLAEVRNQKLG